MAHVVETLRQLPFLSAIHVSTDDAEIKSVAEAAGASCLELRSSELAGDQPAFIDLIHHDIPRFQKANSGDNEVLFVLATAALVPASVYRDAHRVWLERRPDVLMSCEPNFPWFAMTRKDDGFWRPVFPDLVLRNTQDLPEAILDAGLFYFFDWRTLKDRTSLKLVDRLMSYMVAPEYLGDIDTPDEWAELEVRFAKLRGGQS